MISPLFQDLLKTKSYRIPGHSVSLVRSFNEGASSQAYLVIASKWCLLMSPL